VWLSPQPSRAEPSRPRLEPPNSKVSAKKRSPYTEPLARHLLRSLYPAAAVSLPPASHPRCRLPTRRHQLPLAPASSRRPPPSPAPTAPRRDEHRRESRPGRDDEHPRSGGRHGAGPHLADQGQGHVPASAGEVRPRYDACLHTLQT
jgi:hypothetical protein